MAKTTDVSTTSHALTALLCGWLTAGNTVAASTDASGTSADVMAHVEVLGNPHQETYPSGPCIYARNVWDLCASEGELLIGAGNSSNVGPSPNAGPVPLVAYSPSNGQFRTVFTVDDEQIDIFRVLDGKVYIPGHDPRESWELGNFYCREQGGVWRKHRNIPSGIHNYDMASRGGILFAGLGTQNAAAVAMSRDSGNTWTNVLIPSFRIYTFLTAKQQLYATAVMPGEVSLKRLRGRFKEAGTGVYQYDGVTGFRPRNDLGTRQLFPGVAVNTTTDVRIARSVSFKDSAAYVGAYCHNDHQFMPFGAFVAESLEEDKVSTRPAPLRPGSRVWDLLCDADTLYVLSDCPDSEGTIVRVTATTDGVHWAEILHFRSKAFARSFALLDGDFYFGLGCEVADPQRWLAAELLPETGRIERVKKTFWKPSETGK